MLDVGCRLTGSSMYDESRCADEISMFESWRVRAGVGYVILDDAEDKETIDDGEDRTLVPPYDKSGQQSSVFSGYVDDDGDDCWLVRAPPTSAIDKLFKESKEWR